jgi:hypothetical protein
VLALCTGAAMAAACALAAVPETKQESAAATHTYIRKLIRISREKLFTLSTLPDRHHPARHFQPDPIDCSFKTCSL